LYGIVTRSRYMNERSDQIQLQQLVGTAVELGVMIALIETGQIKPYLKKSEAFKLYGRKNIERWLTNSLLTPRKDGDHSAAWRLDRKEIEILIRSIKIQQLLLHAELIINNRFYEP
jgi:hypothetical protein